MRKSLYSGALLAVSFVTMALASSGGALAATCTYTEWANTVPTHPLPQVTKRVCDGELSVNVIGADPNGNTFDFGWADATELAPNSYSSEFVDANATNKIQLDVNPDTNAMQMSIDTKVTASGQSTQWSADYVLSKTYEADSPAN